MMMKTFYLILLLPLTNAFVPFIDGGKGMPKLYDAWFNEQICKQASTAIGKAIAAGNVSTQHSLVSQQPEHG